MKITPQVTHHSLVIGTLSVAFLLAAIGLAFAHVALFFITFAVLALIISIYCSSYNVKPEDLFIIEDVENADDKR